MFFLFAELVSLILQMQSKVKFPLGFARFQLAWRIVLLLYTSLKEQFLLLKNLFICSYTSKKPMRFRCLCILKQLNSHAIIIYQMMESCFLEMGKFFFVSCIYLYFMDLSFVAYR